jgi:hypothetical protein
MSYSPNGLGGKDPTGEVCLFSSLPHPMQLALPFAEKHDSKHERWIANLSVTVKGNAQNAVSVRFWPKADALAGDSRGSFRG